ncbi:hypothetical protein [Stutzerimonas azotifigens]|uniref:Uncharacterized protein n=1 Tax=Stutzerimonas azotifigens TaxID=291995 RepID=A0ABR5YYR6_9GAMM|nr:hypothetical protein [Stutzerimonas azotifigens]MBA1273087.1 hypothetical protein [Stutzerimonas azotifigens]
MPELVMTSWLRPALLALVIGSAALTGSARPVEDQSRFVRTPEIAALMVPDGYPPRLFGPFFQIG